MKREVLLILIGALFCFIAGPTLTDAADMYCPPVRVVPGGVCDCTVYNYGPNADTGVVIEMYDSLGGSRSNAAATVPPGTDLYISWPMDAQYNAWSTVGCKVHGIGVHSRVSIQCYQHPNINPGDAYISYAFAACGD